MPPAPARRSDAGMVKLTGRDITGLVLCAEHFGAPYDLVAAALGVRMDRLRGIVARWRHAGYAATGTLGPGPAWCWLTGAGMTVTGLRYPASRPAVSRLAHIRAVLAVRLWLEAGEVYQEGRAWWRSERRIRAAIGGRAGHRAYPGCRGALAVPGRLPLCRAGVGDRSRTDAQTARPHGDDHAGLLARTSDYGPGDGRRRRPRYAQVVYLTAPAARPVVTRAVAALPAPLQPRIVVRDLPEGAAL